MKKCLKKLNYVHLKIRIPIGIKENYTIIKNILQTDIIELEKIYLKIIVKEGKTLLEIYDEENMYNTIEMQNIEELNVKPNKKIKVFI